MGLSVDTVQPVAAEVAHSVIRPDAVLDVVAAAYPLAPPHGCELIKTGCNDTYLVHSRDARYIVRVYGAGRRSDDAIAYELALLAHLAARGVPVAAAIPAAGDGELVRRVHAPEGARAMTVFPHLRGRRLPWRDERYSRLAGRLLGRLHAGADGFACGRAREALDLNYMIDRPLATLRPFLEHRAADLTYLEGLAARLRERHRSAARGLDWGPCHGDFCSNNLHLADGAVTVFDFDFCGEGWRAYDLVMARWHAKARRRPTMWNAFLGGYREVRPLCERDVDAVPLFDALKHFWGMGRRAAAVPYDGSSRLAPAYLDYRLAAFRRWELENPE